MCENSHFGFQIHLPGGSRLNRHIILVNMNFKTKVYSCYKPVAICCLSCQIKLWIRISWCFVTRPSAETMQNNMNYKPYELPVDIYEVIYLDPNKMANIWKCFLELFLLYFDLKFPEVCSSGPISDMSALVQVLAWRSIDEKPWSAMRHSASMSSKSISDKKRPFI